MKNLELDISNQGHTLQTRPRPRKSLGQYFLTDRNILRKIVAAADISAEEVVVEVGPGLGSLTRELLATGCRVVAVEVDRALAARLQQELNAYVNLRIVSADIMKADIEELLHEQSLGVVVRPFGVAQGRQAHHERESTSPFALSLSKGEDKNMPPSLRPSPIEGEGAGYKVVGNLPYYIASAVVRRFLETRQKPSLMVVTVQKEVAEQMVAKPGQMGILSVATQLYGSPRIVARIKPGSFNPPPKVDSTVVRIDVYDKPAAGVIDTDAFFAVVRAGFSAPRKQLRNSLAQGLGLPPQEAEAHLRSAGIEPARRAETLSLEEWATLYTQVQHARS